MVPNSYVGQGILGITSPEFLARLLPAASPVPPQAAPTSAPGPARTAQPAGGGVGTGTGPGRPAAPTAVPTPVPFPSGAVAAANPVPPGMQRFQGLVLALNTGAPIPGVCIAIGPRGCVDLSPKTDASGTWTADLPVGGGSLVREFCFTKSSYHPEYRSHSPQKPITGLLNIHMRPTG
ncbi:MAG: hypothetical protein FJ034_00600 [Chloroflexi bacterium]|nr:hypothetical protein [Chloroflexota bacterium]